MCSKERIPWSKCSLTDIEVYNNELRKYLPTDIVHEKLFETPSDIDAQVWLLNRAIIQADWVLPLVKPYWNAKLNRLLGGNLRDVQEDYSMLAT